MLSRKLFFVFVFRCKFARSIAKAAKKQELEKADAVQTLQTQVDGLEQRLSDVEQQLAKALNLLAEREGK